MTYAELFNEIREKFIGTDVSGVKEHLAYQFNIEDEEAGGAFYVEVKDGQLYVEPYEYFDRDAMFICSPEVLIKIADGEKDPVDAFFKQELRVEGDIDKALKLKDVIELRKKDEKKAAKKAAEEEKKKAAEEKKKVEEEKKKIAAEEKKKAEEEKKKAAEEKKKAEEEKKKIAAEEKKKAAEEKKAATKKTKASTKK